MHGSSRICGAIALTLAVLILAGARGLTFISNGVPGPGLLPFLLAGLLAACAILLLAGKADATGKADPSERAEPAATGIPWRVPAAIGAMVLYAALMPVLGFVAATLVFVFTLNWWWGRHRWWAALAFAGVVTAVIFLIFSVLLGVPLPQGLLRGQ